jgi:hypothetical protein
MRRTRRTRSKDAVVGMIILFGVGELCNAVAWILHLLVHYRTTLTAVSILLCSALPRLASSRCCLSPWSPIPISSKECKSPNRFLSAPSARHNPVQTMYKKQSVEKYFPNLRLKKSQKLFRRAHAAITFD